MAERKQLVLVSKFSICEKCGEKMEFKGSGIYVCEKCKHQIMDDFGKIRAYIDEHGPAKGPDIARKTGVSIVKINQFLKTGRLEIPESSDIFIKCSKCGCDIRYGRFCPECAAHLAGEIKGAFLAEDVGERPKKQMGKMHFLSK